MMQENNDKQTKLINKTKKVNETVSFFDYDLVKEEAKTKTKQIRIQNKEIKKENKKLKTSNNFISNWNKKQKILFSFFVIGAFLLLISIIKIPYTGAIIDSVVEYFFGWSKYGFYLILTLFFATIYFKKARKKILRPFIIIFLIVLTIFSAYLFGAVGYKIINQENFQSFYNNQITYVERLHFINNEYVGGWSSLWDNNFIKSIDAQNYYFINKFGFGGLIGYINIEVFFDNAWIFIVIISFVVIALFIITYLVWSIKSKHNFRFKIWLTNKLIHHVNKKYKTEYTLVKDNQIIINETTIIEEDHHNDENINSAAVEIPTTTTEQPKTTVVSPPIITSQPIQVNEIKKEQTTKLVETNHQTKPIIQTTSSQLDNQIIEEEKPKPAIKTKAFSFDQTKSTLPQHFYEKNYPSINVIQGRSQEYFHEFQNALANLKDNVIRFFENNDIKYNKQSLKTIMNYYSVEVEVNLVENGIYNFFNVYKNKFINYIKTEDNDVIIYNRFGNLVANLRLKKMQHQINIKDILKEIPYSSDLCIGIGKERKSGAIWLDDRNGSMIVFGSPYGSGKKMLFSVMLMTAIYKKSYKELQIYLVDNKSKGTKGIENLSHVKKNINYEDVDGINAMLKEVKDLIVEQKALFAQHNVSNINEYNEKNKHNQLPKHIIFISEFIKIIESKQEQRFKSSLISILDAAKEHGIIVILSSDEISQQTTSYINLFTNLIVLKVEDENQSVLINGNNLFSNLDGGGDMYIMDLNTGLRTRAQVARIDNENLDIMIQEIKDSSYGLVTTTKQYEMDR